LKQATCKELKGVCDTVLEGETPEEMGLASRNHVMELVQKGDKEHLQVVNEMMRLTKKEQQAWYQDFVKNFKNLKEA
jgi:hypothetical protein